MEPELEGMELGLEQIKDKIKAIIREDMGVEVEDTSMVLSTYNIDSLDILEIVMSVEEEFSIEIPDEETDKLNTVDDIANYVHSHQS